MKKQTAIQFLRESIDSEMKLGTKMVVNWDMYLAMEKEQIELAFDEGSEYEYQYHINGDYRKEASTYYNETYGGDK